jgi:hypothetical protein
MTEQKEKSTRAQRLRDFMLSAAAGGGVLTGGQALLGSGTRTLKNVASAAGKGALVSSLLAGTAGLTGDLILGAPKPNETDGNSSRGGIGGLVGGGLVGAGIGGLAASGKLGGLVSRIGKTGKRGEQIAKGLASVLPKDNMVVDKFKSWGADPTKTKTMLGAMLGSGLGGGSSAFLGLDEGMQADLLQSKAREYRKKKVQNGL